MGGTVGNLEALAVLSGERRWSVDHSDCRDFLRALPDCCIDSCVTDPPYELGFGGRAWDKSGIAYSPEMWAEVLRVLKPGAHLLAFGGTRTFHRIACAIEDAGFEIRDSIVWNYASGFPKSLNISRAIDAADGLLSERQVVGSYTVSGNAGTSTKDKGGTFAVGAPNSEAKELHVTRGASDRSRQWDGWGTALKPSQEPIIVARKPLDGTVAGNVLQHGTGGLNVDGCRVKFANEDDKAAAAAAAQRLCREQGDVAYGATLSGVHAIPSFNQYIGGMDAGRWPPNAIFQHAPKCIPDVGCADGCPVLLMDQQSGEMLSGQPVGDGAGSSGIWGKKGTALTTGYDDEGSASRIFPQFYFDDGLEFPPFLYHPKAGRAERDRGLERFARVSGGLATQREDDSAGTRNPRAGAGRTGGVRNIHPTVKAIGLMRWLCRLVTPPGGICLDPFTGSGTSGCAAMPEGFRFIGCELNDTDTEPFVRIARARIAAVLAHDFTVTKTVNEHEKQQSLFEVAS
jgi:site-specific DNA-methyltransferase (adenine-specific)